MKNSIIKTLKRSIAVCLCAGAFVCIAEAQAASGGNYSIEGTIGQSAAGTKQQNSSYTFQTGFWTAQTLAPTAAEVAVGGRVVTTNGNGIRNALVTMVKSSGESRTVVSGAFGYFRFGNVEAGDTCVFSVSAKRYAFSQPVQVRSIVENTDDIIFTADSLKQMLTPPISDLQQP